MASLNLHIRWASLLSVLLCTHTNLGAQSSTVVFDDMCMGCCGLRLTLHGDGSLYYVENGVARFEGFGKWHKAHDTLVVTYDHIDREWRFTHRDSLTLLRVGSSFSLPLLKVNAFAPDSLQITYVYNADRSIHAISTHHGQTLIHFWLFDKKRTCEMTYAENGRILSDGCLRRGRKIGVWNYYNDSGELLRSEKH